ncbi:DoxX family protein [Aquimarina rhabdastrellae]
MKKNIDLGILILRLTLGILMLFHGIAKLSSGVSFIESTLEASGLPSFIAYGVYFGEVIAPVLLIIGYRTRIAALLLSFTMLFAMLMVHSAEIFTLSPHGGWAVELLGLFLFGGIALFYTGGGKYAFSKTNTWD